MRSTYLPKSEGKCWLNVVKEKSKTLSRHQEVSFPRKLMVLHKIQATIELSWCSQYPLLAFLAGCTAMANSHCYTSMVAEQRLFDVELGDMLS